ncbi:UbiA family prenyltransferase, partial [Patescibacteria group bacterium]
MIKRLLNFVENAQVTFYSWITAFFSVIFIRIFLENISSKTFSGIIGSDIYTIVHYYLFYLSVALFFILILSLFIKDHFVHISKVILFGMIITWIPPIIDMIVSRGKGIGMAYLFQLPIDLARNFFLFFGAHKMPGITPGIRIEIFLVLISVFFYTKWKTKDISKSIFVFLISYLVLFFLVSLPSFVAFGQGDVLRFFLNSIRGSLFEKNFLHQTIRFSSLERQFEIYFNGAISHIYYFLVFGLSAFLAFLWNKQKLIAILKNSRIERVAHYWLMIVLGAILAIAYINPLVLNCWLDISSLIILLLSFYFAWMFAVGVNDIADQKIDFVSNKKRPLIVGTLCESDIKIFNFFFLIWAILGGFLVGHYALFMIIAFTALYYVYSSPLLQLKRFVILNSFIISLCCLSAVFAGFFTVSENSKMSAFPINWLLLIVFVFVLSVNIKDIKDIKGDRRQSIHTIPVIFGEKKGKKYIGIMFALSFLIVPYFSGLKILWYISILSAIIGYYLVNKKVFCEQNI